MKKIISLILILFIVSTAIVAQNISGKTDKSKYLIGDKIEYSFSIPFSNNNLSAVTQFQYSDTLQLLNQKIDTIKEGGKTILYFKFSFISFIEGIHNLPIFYIMKNSSSTPIYNVNCFPIVVSTPTIDTNSVSIKDIKPIQKSPISFIEILPFIIGLLILGGIIYGIIYLVKHKKTHITIIPKKIEKPLPEDIEALNNLENLRQEHLLEKGLVKQHYISLSDILWKYLYRRYDINAFEMTSSQILNDLNDKEPNNDNKNTLKDIFIVSDLVKFAKYIPDNITNTKIMQESSDFINNTKRIIIEKEDKDNE